ncbi:MAG: primosomal protein N', partial [Nocardioidaceae bacterium]
MAPPRDPQQLALLKGEVRRRQPLPSDGPAPTAPVAEVLVDLPLAHLNRSFDYVVPTTLHEQAVPGCRVKVRFSGRDVDGYLVARRDESDHPGRLSSLRKVVSAEPVLAGEVRELATLVSDRYAGTVADVLRLAVPPRHARVEAERPPSQPSLPLLDRDVLGAGWSNYAGGAALVSRLAAGAGPRGVWTALPGEDWPARLAQAAAATSVSGRGTLLCLPDTRDVARVDAALTDLLGAGNHVVLTAELGPAARYRAFLAVLRGDTTIVVGTRAAAFAPVHDLGLVALWDDGDDLYAEPRAPYPHAREVLLLRTHQRGCALLIASAARSVEAQALVESGWAIAVEASRAAVRARAPQVHITGESEQELERDSHLHATRMPRRVFEVVRAALADGPVLVHSPRHGYHPALTCATCWHPARCERCSGPLARQAARAAPRCRWCDLVADPWRCPHCRHDTLRVPVVGALRTAEEWGRSFPQTPVVSSGGEHVLDEVAQRPAVVVATPGAEPVVEGGYAAAVLLDTWLSLALTGTGFRASEEALRRWIAVASLVKPTAEGGRVVAVGDPSVPALQALVRWDPAGFASRELADRASARLTPAARLATVTGPPDIITDVLAALELPRYSDVLGPVDVGGGEPTARIVVRTPRERGAA